MEPKVEDWARSWLVASVMAFSASLISASDWKPPVAAVRPRPSESSLAPSMLRLDEPVSLKVTLREFSDASEPLR
ncbi:hypothetical protein ASF39_08090 [Methylobacterium sp. Leaf108]|nr:hypothetical protein ASF39_08090 [Methylobacterium sp. Leaf108]